MLLLDSNPKWPDSWSKSDWEKFISLCISLKLELLLFFRVKNCHNCNIPAYLFHQLNDLFDLNLVHIARLKHEVYIVQRSLRDQNTKLCYFKGFALIHGYYPNFGTRQMQDVDCMIQGSLDVVFRYFKDKKYIRKAEQSKIEKKHEFYKLLGPHTFSFEVHRTVHTSYFKKHFNLNCQKHFDKDGYPSPEILLLSIILHHKFFECSLRDFFDISFIFEKKKQLNWSFIWEFCYLEGLSNQLLIMKFLYEKLLKQKWPESYQGKNVSVINFIKRKIVCWLKINLIYSNIVKRSKLTKILDSILIFFVYDSFSLSFKLFFNKYFKYVFYRKYLQIFR